LNESDTRAEIIEPKLRQAGWGVVEDSYIRREVLTPGRLIGNGRRAPGKKADFVLIFKGHKLAVIEAKSVKRYVSEGLAQAKEYAEMLHVRHTYATNGEEIYVVDMETGQEGEVDRYPSPDELWQMTFAEENYWRDQFAKVPFEDKGGQWSPRYYQEVAIRKTTDAIASGKDRILLTLATGTGKTAIAFQVSWKLFQSRWNLKRDGKRRPRILFLADRNILADQAYNSFSAFADDALVRIRPDVIRKQKMAPKNGNVFFTIFQTFMTGNEQGETQFTYGDYPPDFFDLVIIDECHRGGASDESNWRKILEYFQRAVQLGLTATPKRKVNADTYSYFGEPVYIYSLKEGINDGFLSPFKVRQFSTTLDKYIFSSDDLVIDGDVEEGREYKEQDFNKIIEIKAREKKRVELFMQEIDQKQKTLVFCATQTHALAIRDLINQIKKSNDPNYCHRVTADDQALGEEYLRKFQDNEKIVPTILTTSQKLSTGVDARNVRNIVLLRPVNSMIEFKQIVGRGTRLFDGKDYFTIYDFVEAYHHFSDPEWDGEPLEPEAPTPRPGPEPEPDDTEEVNEDNEEYGTEPETTERPKMLKIKLADGKERQIQHMSKTMFWHADGTPISAEEFLQQLYGDLPTLFKNEDELRELWSKPDTRKALLARLAEKGYTDTDLVNITKLINAESSDLFDVLAYIAYKHNPVTRKDRVTSRREHILTPFDDKQREFIDFVLGQYIDVGYSELNQEKLPSLIGLKYKSINDAKEILGSPEAIRDIFIEFQKYLYDRGIA
jgi:type I restriction enzyme R subunit